MRSGSLRSGASHGLAGASLKITEDRGVMKILVEDVRVVPVANGVSSSQSLISPYLLLEWLRTPEVF
jgi:hypothetical protein